MKTRPASFRPSLNILAGLLGLLGAAASAHAADTVIDTLPYTITSPGNYVLNANLNSAQTDGKLITVNASNVSIDFQNHYISGPANNPNQDTIGVYANEKSNLTIINGTVAFCSIGIEILGNGTATTNSVDHQIDNMRVTYCYIAGIYASQDPASRVTNCQVSQCGSSTGSGAYGIFVNGAGVTVQGNVVSTVLGTGSYGIATGTGSFARQNTISNCTYGVYGGKYQDNLTANCTTAYSNGTDAGGNN